MKSLEIVGATRRLSLKMVCILGEMLRESGVKLAKEMGCRMRGMVKRKLLCSAMSHTGLW